MNSNRKTALLGLLAFAFCATLAAKAPSFSSENDGRPCQTDHNLSFNPPSSLNILCPADPVFQVQGTTCAAAAVTLPSIQAQNVGCSGAVILTATSVLGVGFGPFWNVLAGDYSVVVKATNACGDEASCSFTIRVRDLKKPQINVVQTLFSNILADGSSKITARMFDQNTSDNCTSAQKMRFSFSQNPADSVRQMTCDSLGERVVKIFAFDEAGNFASKSSKIALADPLGACATIFLAGKIETEMGQPVGQVDLKLTFDGQILNQKAEAGHFFIADLPAHSAVSIAPKKVMNPLNGVSTYDLSLLSKHILGQEKLSSPYKIIAADVNRSGKVTTADLVQLRKLILGELTDFTSNDSWRFVPRAFVFADPTEPFSAPIAEKMQFLAGGGDQVEADFVGIKIGDLNCSATAENVSSAGAEDRSSAPFSIQIFDQNFEAGDQVEALFQADLGQAEALQTTINFEANALIFNELDLFEKGNFSAADFGLRQKATGKIALAWTQKSSIEKGQKPLFKLHFTALENGKLSDVLNLGSLPTASAAYSKSGVASPIQIVFAAQKIDEKALASSLDLLQNLLQNQPNPMVETTSISFIATVAEPVFFKIVDPSGRLVFEKTVAAAVGLNRLDLSKNDLGSATGLLFYQVKTSVGTASRSMFVAAP